MMPDEMTVTTTETAPVVEATTTEDVKPSLESMYDWEPPKDDGPVDEPAKEGGDDDSATGTDAGDRGDDSIPDSTEIDEELLAQADAWGISREVAHKLGEATLAKEVNRLWAKYAVNNAQQTQREGKPATQEERDEIADVLKQIDDDPDGYDDKFKTVLKGLYTRVQQQDRALQEFHHNVAVQQRFAQEAVVRKETEEWDGLFNNVEMDDLFGKGGYGDLKADSEPMKNRFRVMEQVNVQHSLAQRRGEKISNRELLLRACAVEFPDRNMKQATKQLADKVSTRAGQSIGRAAARKGVPVSAERRAEEAVAATMRKHGMRVEESDNFVEF